MILTHFSIPYNAQYSSLYNEKKGREGAGVLGLQMNATLKVFVFDYYFQKRKKIHKKLTSFKRMGRTTLLSVREYQTKENAS